MLTYADVYSPMLRMLTYAEAGDAQEAMRLGDVGAARRALSHARAAFVRAAVHDGEREVEELEAQLDRLEAAGGAVREAAAALADAQQVPLC